MAIDGSETTDRKMALYIDLENLVLGVREAGIKKFKIKLVLERILEKGNVLSKKLIDCVINNKTVKSAAQPERILLPMFSRYEKGMAYGQHLDAPIMRVAALDTPVPFNRALEADFLPKERIAPALEALLRY